MKTILAADDSPLALKMLSRLLENSGYDVVTATDGIEAAQLAYGSAPDLIILDIEMPRMNGYHVCRLLKRDPRVANIPVIILTSVDVRGTEFWSLSTGANAFIVKSSEPSELLAMIQRLLERDDQTSDAPEVAKVHLDTPSAEEILGNVCALMDDELYLATVGRIELKTVLQNLRDGVLTIDLNNEITTTNQALCDMLGKQDVELIGQKFASVLGDTASRCTVDAFQSALDGRDAIEHESVIESTGGDVTQVAVSAVLLRDYLGATIGCVCLFHDISRRKIIEALYEQLKSLDKAKNDLTHMIVHDLRTPLTSLLGGIESIEATDDNRELLEISIGGGNSLLEMINDLLDVSKMEEGLLILEQTTFDLAQIAEQAISQVAWLANDKNLALKLEISPLVGSITADAEKLRRVLVNLLGNAVKFTPAKGQITLIADRNVLTGDITIGVQDTGEGIPREAFERIFEKFEQVETRKAGKKMSTGLGLTFCKLVTEAHGGRIWVESEPDQGSTFFLTLPQ